MELKKVSSNIETIENMLLVGLGLAAALAPRLVKLTGDGKKIADFQFGPKSKKSLNVDSIYDAIFVRLTIDEQEAEQRWGNTISKTQYNEQWQYYIALCASELRKKKDDIESGINEALKVFRLYFGYVSLDPTDDPVRTALLLRHNILQPDGERIPEQIKNIVNQAVEKIEKGKGPLETAVLKGLYAIDAIKNVADKLVVITEQQKSKINSEISSPGTANRAKDYFNNALTKWRK